MQVSGGNVTLDNVVLTNNQASLGGGVYAEGNSKVTLLNCGFRNNQGQQAGRDVFIKEDEPVQVQVGPMPLSYNITNGYGFCD